MAYIYPELNPSTNLGEQYMYEKFRELLPSGFVCYHNREAGLLEFDFAILVPGRGVLICEVKGHKASDIKRASNEYYILQDDKEVYSPYEQAKKYRRLFAALISDQMGKEIPVFAVACFPFITEKEFYHKELHTISPREVTFLADDINPSLTGRIIDLLTEGRRRTEKQFSELTLNLILKIRHIFEPEELIERSLDQTESKPGFNQREHYSGIAVLPAEHVLPQKTEIISELISRWRTGTKLCVITDDESLLADIRIEVDNFLRLLDANSYERFTLFDSKGNPKDRTFNMEFYYLADSGLNFRIEYNCVLSDEVRGILKLLDEKTAFNLSQYELEHADIDKDIMVVAGAGTGKTTSMIARINYLIYCHRLTADSLPNALFMLTFTKEAARNMKQKLKDYFQDYFLLTMDYEALRLSECVEGMRIGTIHSLSKRILEHYSVHLGLGKSLQIVSGKHEKDRFLTNALNDYVESHEHDGGAISLPMYELHSRLSDIMTKLQNKNLDINHDELDWGNASGNQTLHDIITNVPEIAERNTRAYFDELSSIRLSDLMIKLKELVRDYGDELGAECFPIRYVFIDEFQDTDDIQIDLIQKFKAVFGFSLFVVGDVKQCIYRFRGATDKAFDVLAPDKGVWDVYGLTKNYRTDKYLLEAYDARFSRWGENDLLEYRDVDRLVGVRDFNGGLQENAFYYRETHWNSDATKGERLLLILRRLMVDLEPRPDEQIAILVRENWQVEKIKELCSRGGIGVETDVGGELYKLRSAIDLYKLVKALQHHKTPKYLFNLYSTFYVDAPMPKEAVFIDHQSSAATEKLLGLFNVKLAPIPKWDKYVEALKYEPALKVLREIVLSLRPWVNYAAKELTESDNKRAQIFYRHNLDAIFEKLAFEFNSDYLTISRIERFLEIMILTGQKEQSREPFISERQSKIVCMTVHKAKGLEYHTVILPYMASAIGSLRHKGDTDIIALGNRVGYSVKNESYQMITNDIYQDFKTEEARDRRDEEARILYVAMTRAKRRFIYFDDQKNSGTLTEPKNWQTLLRGEAQI